jgi:glycine/D-amino acid oxidase-like deaminating enzyme
MPSLLIVGGGLYGSLAAAYARRKGIEAIVFDAGLPGAASPAAAGLFTERWAGKRFLQHYHQAIPVLERLCGIRSVSLSRDDGGKEALLFVPPRAILDPAPRRERVTVVGDGWLEAGDHRHEGWVYVAAGVWCGQFLFGLQVYGKGGAAFVFVGEQEARMRMITRSRQAIAFVRDPGTTHFTDGTAERDYTESHDEQTLGHAASMGLTGPYLRRLWGYRPYTPGGPVFLRTASRTWVATGGRKMGTVLGAAFAKRLVEEELR